MKRKRGSGKRKSKLAPVVRAKEAVPNIVSLNTQDDLVPDDFDNAEFDSRMEVETPQDGSRSRQQANLQKQKVIDATMGDSMSSSPEMSVAVSANLSKKARSIMTKSSRGFVASSIEPGSNAEQVQNGRTHQKEANSLHQDPQYEKQELKAALEVIKKVMKMDAAEPFNAPVNPVALGIPDYFDVIDTPMDFGTICSNLESGVKYMNSEDVFKDVQYIWENCYKYNNKGDYVVELMKRVKKNFSKYWTAAGLYTEQPGINGVESIQSKDVAPSSNEKMQVKGGSLKHKMRKRHGVKRHKDDCLCAICVMMRRRQEREESAQIEDQIGTSYSHLAQEVKPEEPSPGESPYGEDTSSNMDNSPGPDADADLEEKVEEVKLEDTKQLHSPIQEKQEEEKGNEMDMQTKGGGEISGRSQPGERSGEEYSRDYPTHMVESGGDMQQQVDAQTEEISMQHELETVAVEQQKLKELSDKRQKAKMYENLRRFQNPMLLKLCGTLFPDNHKSVWSGPHSLARRPDLGQSSSIHEAIMTFMK